MLGKLRFPSAFALKGKHGELVLCPTQGEWESGLLSWAGMVSRSTAVMEGFLNHQLSLIEDCHALALCLADSAGEFPETLK